MGKNRRWCRRRRRWRRWRRWRCRRKKREYRHWSQWRKRCFFSIQKIFSFDCLPKKNTFLNCFESLVAVAGKDTLCLQSFNNRNCYYDTHTHTQNFLSKMISKHNKKKLDVIKFSIWHLQIFGKSIKWSACRNLPKRNQIRSISLSPLFAAPNHYEFGCKHAKKLVYAGRLGWIYKFPWYILREKMYPNAQKKKKQ